MKVSEFCKNLKYDFELNCVVGTQGSQANKKITANTWISRLKKANIDEEYWETYIEVSIDYVYNKSLLLKKIDELTNHYRAKIEV
jgi:hypothetical protein